MYGLNQDIRQYRIGPMYFLYFLLTLCKKPSYNSIELSKVENVSL